MVDNPYESPAEKSGLPEKTRPKGSRRVRLGVVLVNACLMLLFPPVGCPCCIGPIGFVAQGYLILLGFPTILAGCIIPEVADQYPGAFFAAYLANVMIVSYLMGHWLSLLIGPARERFSEAKQPESATPPSGH